MRSLNRRHTHPYAGIAGVCLVLVGCAEMVTKKDLSVVESVDLIRYAGTWYEIARLPMWFQRHCVDSKAVYTGRPDGTIGVHNECMTDEGKTHTAEGIATVVDRKTNARLAVVFDNWFARLVGPSHDGNYWILDLDDDYRTALVGTPDREHLWILSRSPHMEARTFERWVQKGRNLGYPMDKLIHDRRAW